MVLTTNLAFENWVSVSAAKSKSCLTSQSWQGRAIGEALARLLWWVHMLLISLEMIVISKIVTYSSPGGQWLPLRGMLRFLPYPTPFAHLLSFSSRGCGFKSWTNFHIKVITRKSFQTNYVYSSLPVSFNSKLYLIPFQLLSAFHKQAVHFFTYPTDLGCCT